MKIGDPTPPAPPSTPGVDEAAAPTEGPAKTEGSAAEDFAERLDKAQQSASAEGSEAVQQPESDQAPTELQALAERIDAGELSGEEALAQLVEQVISVQLPPDAPEAVREKIRTVVTESLTNDPQLSALLGHLGK